MTPVQFLKKFHPDRIWVLTAIATDRKGIDTQSFSPEQSKEAAAWVKEMNAAKKRNLYFSVGEVIRPENSKASKNNIAAVHWLHVDVDPGPGDLITERERILALMTNGLPVGVPKPTAVVFSGGGYQAFWRLAEPLLINGDVPTAEKAELFNKQLELIFAADACHNVDRIMRLPGTTNYPDAKKVAKGRVPIEAKVIYFDKTSYAITEFTPAAETSAAPSAGDFTVEISGNVVRLNSVDELDEYDVPDRIKVIIVQGNHPDETKDGDESRSEWLFDAVCNMKRADVPDEVVYSVITDPNFGISESVLEAKDVDRYAKRQIERAKMEVVSTNLRILNEQHAVILNYGTKCLVVEELYDPVMKRTNLTAQTFGAFRDRYMNQTEVVIVETKDGPKPRQVKLGTWWLEHPKRRSYKTVTFAPCIDTPDAYNLWRGWAYNALPGKNHESLLQHMLDTVCCGNQEHYDYLVGWMATLVQHPARPGGTCVVMRGQPGTGKSFLATHFGKLFGRHFLHISNANHLIGNFNNHLRDALLVFGDEAFYAGDRRHVNVLKTLITEELQMVEAKGRDAEVAPNFANLMLASNSDWVVPVEGQDRRFFVVDVAETHMRNNAHFAAIADELKGGGYENLLYYLMTYDLGSFNLFSIPQTDALEDQKHHSLMPHEEWWLGVLMEGMLSPGNPWGVTPVEVSNPELYTAYIESVRENTVANQRYSKQKLNGYVRKMLKGLELPSKSTTRDGVRTRTMVLPTIVEARAAWNKANRTKLNWDNPEEGESSENLPF